MVDIKHRLNRHAALQILQSMAYESITGNNPFVLEPFICINNARVRVDCRVISAANDGNKIRADVQVQYSRCRATAVEESREEIKSLLRDQLSDLLEIEPSVLEINPMFLDKTLMIPHQKACVGCGRPRVDTLKVN